MIGGKCFCLAMWWGPLVLEKVAEVLAAYDIGVGVWAVGFPWEVAKMCG